MKTVEEIKKLLDSVSPTFCIAKWKQVTTHLETGLTHSCHHPGAHIIPLKELEENISSLHNTNFKKKMRQQMLDGKIVTECKYCNTIEQYPSNADNGIYSDRVYKSKDNWAIKYFDDVKNSSADDDVFPSYFEVSFSSVCNCSCIYCSPVFSTTWAKEIEKFGGYGTSTSTRGFENYPYHKYLNETNPYIEAFWKWWPDLYQNLDVFRITGGEPLLSKHTFKILDYIIENPKHDFLLSMNSNFCINQKIFNKFIDKCKNLSESINVFTSCEAYGKKAEYIRPGLDYDYWMNNCKTFLKEVPNGSLSFMCTFNILSITSFTDFLKDILKLKNEFPLRVKLDVPFLSEPNYLQAKIITKDFLNIIEDSITFMYKNMDVNSWTPLCGNHFFEFEIKKLLRIYYLFQETNYDTKIEEDRKNFAIFIDEHDERYGTNFFEIFPEYSDFYDICKGLK